MKSYQSLWPFALVLTTFAGCAGTPQTRATWSPTLQARAARERLNARLLAWRGQSPASEFSPEKLGESPAPAPASDSAPGANAVATQSPSAESTSPFNDRPRTRNELVPERVSRYFPMFQRNPNAAQARANGPATADLWAEATRARLNAAARRRNEPSVLTNNVETSVLPVSLDVAPGRNTTAHRTAGEPAARQWSPNPAANTKDAVAEVASLPAPVFPESVPSVKQTFTESVLPGPVNNPEGPATAPETATILPESVAAVEQTVTEVVVSPEPDAKREATGASQAEAAPIIPSSGLGVEEPGKEASSEIPRSEAPKAESEIKTTEALGSTATDAVPTPAQPGASEPNAQPAPAPPPPASPRRGVRAWLNQKLHRQASAKPVAKAAVPPPVSAQPHAALSGYSTAYGPVPLPNFYVDPGPSARYANLNPDRTFRHPSVSNPPVELANSPRASLLGRLAARVKGEEDVESHLPGCRCGKHPVSELASERTRIVSVGADSSDLPKSRDAVERVSTDRVGEPSER